MMYLESPEGCPPAHGGCRCGCHFTLGVLHMVACCYPKPLESELADLAEFARSAPVEGGIRARAILALRQYLTPSMVIAIANVIGAARRECHEHGYTLDHYAEGYDPKTQPMACHLCSNMVIMDIVKEKQIQVASETK